MHPPVPEEAASAARSSALRPGRFHAATSSMRAACHAALTDLRSAWERDELVRRLVVLFAIFSWLASWWDQPSAYGWENDGVAPRDFFGGIAENLTPHKAHRYPLFHYLVIGVLSAPVLLVDVLVALISGRSVSEVVVSVPSMTAVAVLTKSLHVAMSCVSCLVLGRITERLFGRTAARWAVLFAVTNLSFGYYARATNSDGPYLMWVVLAIDRLLALTERARPRDYTLFGIFMAAGVATKDQAYATFVFVIPVYLLLLPLSGAAGVPSGRGHFASLARAGAAAIGSYAFFSGGLFNPTGFVARVRMLRGPNSQDWKQYEATLTGVQQNLLDLARLQEDFWWPLPVVILAWTGVVTAILRTGREAPGTSPLSRYWYFRALPLVAGLSHTVAFTLVVARSEHRFVLPLGFWLCVYAGAALSLLAASSNPFRRRATVALGTGALLLGAVQSGELLVTQLYDSRRDVEAFLARLPARTKVETYGLGVYLPRFHAAESYRVTRVSHPGSGRGAPIPGIQEVQTDLSAIESRRPDVLVIPESYASRFRVAEGKGTRAMDAYRRGLGASQFFALALSDRLPHYRTLDVGQVRTPVWYRALGGRALRVHGSTGMPVLVLQRVE